MLLNLAKEQSKLGLQPIILNMRASDSFENSLKGEASRNDIDFFIICIRTGPDIAGAIKIIRYANAVGADIIHSHGYKSNILIGFIPKRARRLPIVTTIHGWTYIGGKPRMRLYEWLDACSLKFIDAVVLVNKAMLSNPRLKKLNQKKVFVVENGIPVSGNSSPSYLSNFATSPPPCQQTQLTQQMLDHTIIDFCKRGYTIGSIGRLSPEKCFKNLLEAIKIVSSDCTDIRLVIIGEGGEREMLEKMIQQLGLLDRVMMPGYRNEAKRYIPYFKVFALSSLTEGLPITILEAMREGVPILSTRVGGVPEALDQGKAGVLVDTSNINFLAQGIYRLRNDPELGKRVAERAKKIVSQNYSSQRMAMGYLNIYKHITKNCFLAS